jgi:[ribosomal protein S18]-alanine N-acetyltransferase
MSSDNHIVIRPMRDADVPRVLEIDRLSFALPWPENAYDYELHENPGSLLWVAETVEPPEVIGMIVVWLIVDEAHIASIAVEPGYRNQGIARQLLSEALKTVIEKGYSIATLEVRAGNLPAKNLYASFGFKTVGLRPRYYRDNNEDALIMTLEGMDQSYLGWLGKRQRMQRTGEPYDA